MHEQMRRLYDAAMELRGIAGQSELAHALNESPQTVNNWERRGISIRGMLNAESALGCSALWLSTGSGSMVKTGGSAEASPAHKTSEPSAAVAVEPGPNRLPIRRALFKLSAGVSGYEVEYESGESEPIFMGKRWFDQNGYRPDKLLAVKVSGRSMEPSLWEGDLVVVNCDDTRPRDGDVFAANYEGELVIKRLKRDGGSWYLASDNADKVRYSDKLCEEGCGLIGRIVYRQTEHI